jgi:hypothetical protein
MMRFVEIAVFTILLLYGAEAGAAQNTQATEAAGTVYNACLGALSPAARDHRGLLLLLQDISTTPQYRDTRWNVNKPYTADAVDILMPMATGEPWPASCKLPDAPASCDARPAEKTIICNPAMGKSFASPLLYSGIANDETYLALRFLVLSFLGHELGHLAQSPQDAAVHHLIDIYDDAYGMKCRNEPGAEYERNADAYGVALACTALGSSPSAKTLAADPPGNVLNTLSRLQDELDENYFTMDDTCIVKKNYPSISRRKHTFADSYLGCFFPHSLVGDLAKEDANMFDRLEKRLTQLQETGFVGSGYFGRGTLYAHLVSADLKTNRYITFDSTGTESTLWQVFQGASKIEATSLSHWRRTGTPIAFYRSDADSRFLIRMNAGSGSPKTELVELQVQCADTGCKVAPRSQTLGEDKFARHGVDGSLLIHGPTRFERYASVDDYFSAHPSVAAKLPDLPTDAEERVTATNASRSVFIPRSSAGLFQTDGGFRRIGVSTGNKTYGRVLFMVATDKTASLDAAALSRGRFLFSVYENPVADVGRLKLWDCPETLLDDNPKITTETCHVYNSPQETEDAVAMATRDLSALFSNSIEPAPTECGSILTVRYRGWVWLLDREHQRETLLPADGLINCTGDGLISTYRARRVDIFNPQYQASESKDIKLSSIPSKDRK